MDDIVVIILTLLVVLVGILNKKKKKNQLQAPVAEQANEPSDFWDMIMDEKKVNRDTITDLDEPEPEHAEVEKPEIEPSYQFSGENEGVPQVEEKMEAIPKNRKRVLIEGEEFSLRKAVIYSEIMNRKYS